MALSPQEIFTKWQVLFADNDIGTISEAFMRDFNKDLTDALGAGSLSDIIPEWTALLTFQTDGSDDGEWCNYADSSGNIRLWKTKTDDNTGNEPPTDPQVTENTNWIEVSASSNSSFSEYVAGVYGAGLVIVFKDLDFYLLNDANRPFESTDFAAELEAGKWLNITSSNSSSITITDANATDALVLNPNYNIFLITLAATLTEDWVPSAITGIEKYKDYTFIILKKVEQAIDMSGTTNVQFSEKVDTLTDGIDPFAYLINVDVDESMRIDAYGTDEETILFSEPTY